MKTILLLCLLALFSCKLDIFGIAKCFVSQPKTQKLGLDILNIAFTKDYSKILPTVLNSLPELYNALMECINEPEKEEDVILKSSCSNIILYDLCLISCEPNDTTCHDVCYRTFCH